MANLRQWIEKAAGDDRIEAVAIGERYEGNEEIPQRLLSWDEARDMLDYEFDDRCCTARCHPVYVWTEHSVIVIAVYDGSTWPVSIPRNPKFCVPGPGFIGGQ